MKKLLLWVLAITFILFIFSAESLLEDIVIDRVEKRINHVLRGKTEIGKFYLGGKGFVFHNIYSYNDDASEAASLVFSAGKVVVPYRYVLNPDSGFIRISKLHLNVLLDEEYSLNLLRITKADDTTKKDTFNLPNFPVRIKVKDSTVNTVVYIRGERFLFKGADIKGVAHIANNRIIYTSQSNGEHIGKCYSEGILDFNTMKFRLSHDFENIKLNKFSKKIFYTLFPFMNDFNFKGFLSINIVNQWDNKKLLPPEYLFDFKDTDLVHKDVPLVINDIFGKLKVVKDNFVADSVKASVLCDQLVFPFEKMGCFGDFADPDKILITDINGQILEGSIKGKVDIVPNKKCVVFVNMKNALAPELLTNVQAGVIPEKGFCDFRGDFFIIKDEKGDQGGKWNTEGIGSFAIKESNLGQIPFILRLFSIFDFSLPTKDNISTIRTEWVYRMNNLDLLNLLIKGDKIEFYGSGIVEGLKDLDIVLGARLRDAKTFSFPPVIGDITRFASNTMLKTLSTVKVAGTVDEPVFKKQFFPMIKTKTYEDISTIETVK